MPSLSQRKRGTTDIPSVRVNEVVRAIVGEHGKYKMQRQALKTLHFALEAHLIDCFSEGRQLCKMTGNKELQTRHLKFVCRTRGVQ